MLASGPSRRWRAAAPIAVPDEAARAEPHEAASQPDQYPDQYREKVRGEIPPWELDVQEQGLTALGRKAEAYRAVRRAGGGLSPADALR
ncbi:hypothetical protein OG765_30990 [Streptomyces sp. NBC_00555]|uniref:hypothetical protein n=1 Tax=Streptomyces sp. NBC_00555 TaxID=2903662 RepID=UPI0022538EFD|nr:hypothetical protein [Streptomyces sp. NBC_00555]MCX5015346.1 hypothetical protein [Streptomyces sp. NBC_00555]